MQGICLWIKIYALSTAYDNDKAAANRTIHIKFTTNVRVVIFISNTYKIDLLWEPK